MHDISTANLVWLIPALPLLGFLLNAFFGKKVLGEKGVGVVATAVVFASFLVSLLVFQNLLALEGEHKRAFASLIPGAHNVPWIDIAGFRVNYGALIDPLSMLMCLIVTGVGGLIHLYATGYMKGDRDFSRFFTYLNLFIFFMLMLVLGENILLMFVGWEGVGACSYLLISFWYEDINNSKAGNKAFIVNRIGDLGFALGIMAIFATFGTLTFYTAEGKGFLDLAVQKMTRGGGELTAEIATLIGLLLFVGACGKSAQFPLYVWLPDAMAGPTPVSALIHAATMVTAGVVMVTRVSPIFVQSHIAMATVAIIGLFTAVFAATIALTQTDIKKVLAYSTVSQLGYMFLGCGVGAFSAGMFHVMTHAFFKALLFLGAGSVIHAMSGEQDMRKMGGLQKKIPITYRTMWFGWLAICGIFPFAGFWSKDLILGFAGGYKPGEFPAAGILFYVVGLATAFMTAFYMTRLMWKTFWSDQRFDEAELGAHGHGGHGGHDDHDAHDTHASHGDAASDTQGHGAGVHESPPVMWIPLAVLAFLSVVGGLVWTPFAPAFEHFMESSVAPVSLYKPEELFSQPVLGLIIGFAVGAAGIAYAFLRYGQKKTTGELLTPQQKAAPSLVGGLYRGSLNLWLVDNEFYRIFVEGGGAFANILKAFDTYVVDGIVRGVGAVTAFSSELFRRGQTGFIRSYALLMLVGVVLVIASLLVPVFSR